MNNIGFICDINERASSMRFKSTSRMLRGVALDQALKSHGLKMFMYSWRHINPETAMAAGYYIINKKFVPTIQPVPQINGYWQRNAHNATM